VVEVGEAWAYRARQADPLVEVSVVRVGVQRPARVLVRFVDPSLEGREEWVPPARLKVSWSDVVAYEARESRWTAVRELSPTGDTAEECAVTVVFEQVIPAELATLGYGRDAGVTHIHDPAGLAVLLGLPDESSLRSDRLSFVEDWSLIVPWPVSLLIALTAAARYPEPVLRYVDADEAEFQRYSIHGKTYPADRHGREFHIEAEHYVEQDCGPYGRPHRELLRAWCGAPAVKRRDELVALRAEVRRLGLLVGSAATALRRAGESRAAARIEHELGVLVVDATGSRTVGRSQSESGSGGG
jgi:hypothetical protein